MIRVFLSLCLAVLCHASEPQRIISVSPNVTEILYGLGVFDRVVAVSEYCTYPPEVKNLPRVGGWANPNLEKLSVLRPDLVIFTEAQAPFLADGLKALGIRYLQIPSQSLNDAFTAMRDIGHAVGREAEARELERRTRASLDEVRTRAHGLPKRTVLCVVDRTPGTLRELYAVTEGSFLAELIEIAGGIPIAPPARAGYGKMSKEAILARNPEVIVDFVHGARGKLAEDSLAVWRDLPELKAVRDHRVFAVHNEFFPHCSQFVAETAKRFAEMIHPEAR
jgi:iron complex transport system substrate-binding protein